MIYKVTDLARDVRVVLDMNSLSTPLADFGDTDTLLVDEIIRSKLVDGVRMACLEAPVYMLGPGHTFVDTIGWHNKIGVGSGRVLLPTDFLRLITFKMSDWERAVTTPIGEDDEEYAMQHSKYGGVKGNPEDPVVAIVQYADGLCLEFFSCKAGESVKVSRARYLKDPSISTPEDGGEEGVDIPEMLHRSAVYYIAALVAEALGNNDLAAALRETGKTLFN